MDSIEEWVKVAAALSLRSGKNETQKVQAIFTTRKVLGAWKALGAAMGLEEEKEKTDYEREMKHAVQFCAWKDCRYYTEKPETATRTCAGCDEVRYCGKPCQQSDWKEGGHKLRCRRIKGG
ncbi:hypothetical protein PENSPDRAFT_651749 [Peniophora sp. CONT]|nr:hypothetical protein PENSPDRAFT_651749 [Peniophora sp. CONT]